MSDNSAEYTNFYLGAPSGVAELHTLEISQPSFSQVWRLQPHYRAGLATKTETGETALWQFVPMQLKPDADLGTLDFSMDVTIGDVGEILPDEIERARAAGTMRTDPPTVIYRIYRSDNLNAPMYGPIDLQAQQITLTNQGAKFTAAAPRLNVNRTGEYYTVDRYPMLAGFL